MTRFATITAPAVVRPTVNLLAAANTPQGESVRWQEGSVYETAACSEVRTLDTCDPGLATVVKAGVGADDPEGRLVKATAIYAEALYECIALPGMIDTYRQRALDALDAELPRAVEHELWTGAQARAGGYDDSRWLIDGARVEVLNGGTAVKPAAALGLLEDALGDVYSGIGIIHCNRHAQVYLPTLTRSGRVIETRVGNRVVPGVGYPGTGPGTGEDADGVAPGANQEWVFITPMVTVRVGAVESNDLTVDPGVNRAQYRARAPFEVSWDGCASAFAILMQTVVEATP